MPLVQSNLVLLLAFLTGGVAASFINCIIFRLESGEGFYSIVNGRSHCDKCEHKLSWYELVPIVSYIYQAGRCRKCSTSLSRGHVVLEITGAIGLAVLVSLTSNPIYYTVFFILLFLGAYDYHHFGIPKNFTNVVVLFSLLYLFYEIIHLENLIFIYEKIISVFVVALLYVYSLIRRKFGLGDILVLFSLALVLSPALFLGTMLSSAVFGMAVIVTLSIYGADFFEVRIPYIYCLLVGYVVAFIDLGFLGLVKSALELGQ